MTNISEELTRLAQLRDQGVLTDAEFDAQKAALLRGDNAAPAPAAAPRRGVAKGCGIVAIVLVVLVIIGAIINGSKTNTVVAPGGSSSETAASDAGPALTMDGYNRVKNGMTFDQVVAIVGKPSQELSRNEMAGTETVMYQWDGSIGANMNAMFQDGKLVQKAQFGLR